MKLLVTAFAVLTTSVITAGEIYHDALLGTETIPAGNYGTGSITVPPGCFGTTLTVDKTVADLPVVNTGIQFTNHTVAFWFKPTDNSGGAGNIDIYSIDSKPGAADNYDQYDFRQTTGNVLELWVENGNSTIVTPALTPGVWCHVAVTLTTDYTTDPKSGTGRIFINGIEEATSTPNQFNVQLNGNQSVVDSEVRFFSGQTLAGIYIDDTVLNDTSIQEKAVSSIPVTLAPVAVSDDFVFSAGTVSDNVMTNDENIVVANTEAHLVTAPKNHIGSFVLNTDGAFTYTTADLALPDSFSYELRSASGTVYNTVSVILTPGQMAAYWGMDETTGTTITDSSPLAYVGTLTGGVSFSTSDKALGESALSFDGLAGTRVDCDNAISIDTSRDFTISTYIKTSGTSSVIVAQKTLSETWAGQFKLFVNASGQLQFWLYYAGAEKNITSVKSVNDGVWHHVAVVREAGAATIYIDGMVDSTVASGFDGGLHNPGDSAIGADITTFNGEVDSAVFSGLIDEFGLFQKALSAPEVRSMVPDPLIAHFKMDEITGSSFVDEKGSLSGTYVGTVGMGTESANANLGTAVTFDGNSSNYATSGASDLLTGSTFTVAFWAKGDPAGGHEAVVSSRNGNNNGWIFYYEGGNAQFWVSNGGNYTWNVKAPVDTGWHHYVGTFDGSTVSFYIDGVYVNGESGVNGYRALTSGEVFTVGRSPESGAEFPFTGSVDDVRYYNEALGGDEVSALYNNLLTPAIGVEVTQTGMELSWTVEDEIGVLQYEITVDGKTTVVMFDEYANGSYSITLASDFPATVTVVDKSGFTQTFVPSEGNIVKVVYDLIEGWNLIAMPGANADTSKVDSPFWGWNGFSYEVVEAPTVGKAVWVYSPVEKQVIISAERVETELNLETGWNMVGPTENIRVPAEAHAVYGWNREYQSIATEEGVLLQGVGYWIFSL